VKAALFGPLVGRWNESVSLVFVRADGYRHVGLPNKEGSGKGPVFMYVSLYAHIHHEPSVLTVFSILLN
jgi:hypothetical protein